MGKWNANVRTIGRERYVRVKPVGLQGLEAEQGYTMGRSPQEVTVGLW